MAIKVFPSTRVGGMMNDTFTRYAQEMYLMNLVTQRYGEFLGKFRITHDERYASGQISVILECESGKKYIGNSFDALMFAVDIGYCKSLPYMDRKCREAASGIRPDDILKEGFFIVDDSNENIIECTDNTPFNPDKDKRFIDNKPYQSIEEAVKESPVKFPKEEIHLQ
jgi:hypothetical protein